MTAFLFVTYVCCMMCTEPDHVFYPGDDPTIGMLVMALSLVLFQI